MALASHMILWLTACLFSKLYKLLYFLHFPYIKHAIHWELLRVLASRKWFQQIYTFAIASTTQSPHSSILANRSVCFNTHTHTFSTGSLPSSNTRTPALYSHHFTHTNVTISPIALLIESSNTQNTQNTQNTKPSTFLVKALWPWLSGDVIVGKRILHRPPLRLLLYLL